jgi:hypothetical protein
VRNGINECIVLFVPADFTNEECRINHESEDNYNKEDDSENEKRHFAPVEYDPTDIQGYRQSDKACSQRDEKRDRFSTASYTHRPLL